MKKLFVMLCAAVALFSCTKEYPVTEEPMASPMTFNLSVSHADADATKALKSGWEDGDVVYVFFKDIEHKYLKLSYDGTDWTKSEPGGEFIPSDFDGITDPADKLMTAVYIPYYDVKVFYDNKKLPGFYFSDASGESIHTYYMFAEAVPYEVSGKEVSGTLTMQKPGDFVQFFVPNIPEEDAPLYRLREDNLMASSCNGVFLTGKVDFQSGWDGYCLQGFPYQGGVLFAGELTSAGTATDYAFQLVKYASATKACAEGTYEIKGNKSIDAGVVLRFPALTAWTYGNWVDMGPAGKWATGNLTDDGSGSGRIVAPDQAGKYYAWGETVGYEPDEITDKFSHSFDWTTYTYANDASYKLTKYCSDAALGNDGFTDDKTVLTRNSDDCDDAATKNLGSGWRMPTEKECRTLVDKYEFYWIWQKSADGYATSGHLVTCYYTGLSMFLPAAGIGEENGLYDTQTGVYWSSSRDTFPESSDGARNLFFSWSDWEVSSSLRCFGLSVRAVKVTE